MTRTKTIGPGVLISVLLLICMGQTGSCGKSTTKKNSPAVNKSNSPTSTPSPLISVSTEDDQNMNKNKAQTTNHTAETEWGGNHVRLVIKSNGADLEFDCAHGEVTEPIAVDSEGNFSVGGTFTPESGSVVSTESPAPRNARYVGHIVNDKMNLMIQLAGPDETTETFYLTRGSAGRLRKCR